MLKFLTYKIFIKIVFYSTAFSSPVIYICVIINVLRKFFGGGYCGKQNNRTGWEAVSET